MGEGYILEGSLSFWNELLIMQERNWGLEHKASLSSVVMKSTIVCSVLSFNSVSRAHCLSWLLQRSCQMHTTRVHRLWGACRPVLPFRQLDGDKANLSFKARSQGLWKQRLLRWLSVCPAPVAPGHSCHRTPKEPDLTPLRGGYFPLSYSIWKKRPG